MNALIHGIQLGIIIFFLVGPVFILLLEETIRRGKQSAVILASGLWLSDFSFALIAHFGVYTFLKDREINYNWGYVAVFIFLIAGITAIKTRNTFQKKSGAGFSKIGNLFTKGFLVNTFNPFMVVFWLAVATQVNYSSRLSMGLFYGSLFCTIAAGDLLKIFITDKIAIKLKPIYISYIRAFGGMLLIIFALIMAFRIYII